MKRLFSVVTLSLLTLLCGVSAYSGKIRNIPLPEDAETVLRKAVELVDMGMYDAALSDFETLGKEFPDNYMVQYEYAYLLYRLNRFKDLLPICKRLIASPDASFMPFQMYGNALDLTGKTDEARKVYEKGLKLFPDAGALYLELGNLYLVAEKYNDALKKYTEGIMADPKFASNYYRAADLYLDSTTPIWGLVYGECEVFLLPGNTERHKAMASKMLDCFRKHVTVDVESDSVKAEVSMAKSRNLTVSEDIKTVYADFQGVYEGCLCAGLVPFVVSREPFTGSIKQIAELRRGALTAYYDVAKNMFGNSMYLLEYQKKVLDAGHWDAYNYFLFGEAAPEEYSRWIDSEENEQKMTQFIDWFNTDPFTLDKQHTVCERTIYRDYTPISMMDYFFMVSAFEPDGKKDELFDNDNE